MRQAFEHPENPYLPSTSQKHQKLDISTTTAPISMSQGSK
jgi:hypothetical protein